VIVHKKYSDGGVTGYIGQTADGSPVVYTSSPPRATKHDVTDGKVTRKYMHPATREALELAHEAGARKYGELNFLQGHTTTQLLSAIIRHAEALMWEGDVDADCTSRLGREVTHWGCILAGINMALTQQALGTLVDDRDLGKRTGRGQEVSSD
jgi:hypothetical protein